MTYLFILRHSPYGSLLAREAIDMAMAAAAFDQKVQLLFMHDGIFQLKAEQNTEALHSKNLSKTLGALALYDIHDIFVDQASLQRSHLTLEDLCINASIINHQATRVLLKNADKVMSF